MVDAVVQSFEPTFPTELSNVYQWTCDNMARTNSIDGFHNTIQSLVTNMHSSVRKLIPLLMNEEISVKKEKARC